MVPEQPHSHNNLGLQESGNYYRKDRLLIQRHHCYSTKNWRDNLGPRRRHSINESYQRPFNRRPRRLENKANSRITQDQFEINTLSPYLGA